MTGFAFFQRRYPSANCVLLHGERPVLVDPGFGSDTDALLAWLATQGTPPQTLSLIVNTHHHSDHVGGNHRLQPGTAFRSRRIAGRPSWSTGATRKRAAHAGWISRWKATRWTEY